jgi:hypothetical protein
VQQRRPVSDPLWLRAEIQRLCAVGSISAVSADNPVHAVFPVFLVHKPGPRRFRLVHDLRELNKALPPPPKVRFESWPEIQHLLQRNDLLVSIDLQDGYHLVPLAPRLAALCGFEAEGIRYRFDVLPFGLAWSPAVFTNLLRPVLQHLRGQQLRASVYLDDFLLMAQPDSANAHLGFLVETFHRLGLVISPKKPLVLSHECEHLGLIINTESMTMRLPQARVEKTLKLCRLLLQSLPRPSYRLLLKLQGTLASALLALDYARAHSRALAYLRRTSRVLPELYNELRWWLAHLRNHPGRPIHTPLYRMVITTDASELGYGGHVLRLDDSNVVDFSGPFSNRVRLWPASHRELLGALLVLKSALHLTTPGDTILLRSDSVFTVAAATIGSHASVRALRLAKKLHRYLARHQVRLQASHIAGVLNTRADALSRSNSISEFPVCTALLDWVHLSAGLKPDCDLFASDIAHLPGVPFMTRQQDAFTCRWDQWSLPFLNPPIGLLSRVLTHFRQFGRQALLLHPDWPGAVWAPLLRSSTRLSWHLPPRWKASPADPAWAQRMPAAAGALSRWHWKLSLLEVTPDCPTPNSAGFRYHSSQVWRLPPCEAIATPF